MQSQFYPVKLCRKLLEGMTLQIDVDHLQQVAASVLGVGDDDMLERSKALGLDAAVRRFHVNLGHATVPDMIRILKDAGTAEQVLAKVRCFACNHCDSRD